MKGKRIRRVYTHREFRHILSNNGYFLVRITGSHHIYKNVDGDVISVPIKLNRMIARRLIKEHNLKID